MTPRMTPHFADDRVTLYAGDSLEVLPTLPDNSVDAVVTDPPYSLSFMSARWDTHATPRDFQAWCQAWAAECLRILKPGGHLLAFGGTRTSHRLACAIEDAGFEIRDSIAWLYGSGFPKSRDVSKAIDAEAGAEREVVGTRRGGVPSGHNGLLRGGLSEADRWHNETAPATEAARQWQGWGTALKPAHEPIVVARKPLVGTVAANVLAYGTGALNIDAARIGTDEKILTHGGAGNVATYGDWERQYEKGSGREYRVGGRWPANVVLDEHAAQELDQQSGEVRASGAVNVSRTEELKGQTVYSPRAYSQAIPGVNNYADTGGASRFFYTAKASTDERITHNGTTHPTVKPLDLMRWLVRLVVPPGGVCLEPFAGSGTTVEACLLEGFRCIAIEREPDYLPLIVQRINRRRDPVAYIRAAGEDLGLFGLDEGA